jgi:NADH:ubiquinone oxidoreductase subunit F (NADH-binding)
VLRGSDGLGDYAELTDADSLYRAVEASGLRGRGGAAYPTAAKWKAARETPALDRWVVANGDEGDPGSYIDRLLLEEAPHSVLAGMKACARVIGARHGIVFIRGEYEAAQDAMERAMDRARDMGFLGADFDVELYSGAGSYVAGEESALLRSIEGMRAEPAPKPPYPAQSGLHGLPTVVQNVETLSIIPWIARNHRAANAKALCVSGCVRRPGVVEARMGTSLRSVLMDGAEGPLPGRRWKMALVGGPLGTVIPESAFNVQLSYEQLPALGHGGVVVFDESVTARSLAEHLMRFFTAESCGNCAPCRIGCTQLPKCKDGASMENLVRNIRMGSLCGFGQGVGRPLLDLLRHFPQEMFP